MLDIRLLGEPRVTTGGSPVTVETQKAIAVLAFLAVEGSASRDSLSFLLWADSAADRARATLRRTLSALRNAIGADHLASDRNKVSLDGDFFADVTTFRDEISATEQHEHGAKDVCPDCIEPLQRAAALYRGEFLATFSVRGAPDFETWTRTVAESFRMLAGTVFQRLGMALAAEGDYDGAISAVTRWVEIDPLHEPAHRQLMLLNAWAGDRPGAIEAYRACVAVLDEELGVSPLEETSELYEAILEEDLPPAPGLPRRPRAHPAPERQPTSFFGRASELARMIDLGSPTAEGVGRLIVVRGRPWMGKTHLLEEASRRARDEGVFVVTGRASRFEQTVPYGVLTQLLDPLLDKSSSSSRELEPWAFDEISRLIPRVAHGTGPGEPDRLGDLRLLEAIHGLIEMASVQSRTWVTIDDAQWLDVSSARALDFLIARRETSAVTYVMTINEEPADRSILDLLGSADEVITLHPLTVESLDEMDRTEEAESVISATGGVPLLVLESLAGGAVSPSVGRFVDSRVKGLSDLARQILSAASVLGSHLDPWLLRETSGRSEEEVVDAVEELIEAGLLRDVPDAALLGFTVGAVEGIAYEAMSLVRRRLLHRRAAEALQSAPRAREDVRMASAIAEHYAAAGSQEAADWYRVAGDLARLSYANQEAIAFYENAIALGYPDVARLHLSIGEIALAEGDYQRALKKLRTAASRAEGPTLGEVEHRIGEVHRLTGRFDLAEQSFSRAADSHPRPSSLYAEWALLHHRQGSEEDAFNTARHALELAVASQSRTEVARAHNVLAVIEGDPERAMAHAESALDSAENEAEVMAALNNKARLLAEQSRFDDAMTLVGEAIDQAERTGHRHRQAALLNRLADIQHKAGNTSDAERSLTRAVTLFSEIDAETWEPELWLMSHW